MKNSAAILIGLVTGGAIGSGLTYIFVRDKFAKQSQAEIEQVREYYKSRKPADICEAKKPAEEKPKSIEEVREDIADYKKEALRYGFPGIDLQAGLYDVLASVVPGGGDPFVISPEEFGEIEEYNRISLTYYNGDGVLADDGDEIVDDLESTVGKDFADHFGEYEDDSVFICNPARKSYYEILLDVRKYADILKLKPPDF